MRSPKGQPSKGIGKCLETARCVYIMSQAGHGAQE